MASTRTTTVASTTDETMIAVHHMSRALLLFLALGVGLNFFWTYEWLCIRNTDLYSWAPSAQHSYRCDYGVLKFSLPREDAAINGVRVEDLPGIPIPIDKTGNNLVAALQNKKWDESNQQHQEMIQKLNLYRKKTNASSIDDIPLATKQLHLIFYVNQTETEALNWTAWLMGTNIPRVEVRAYAEWSNAWRAHAEFLTPVRTREYWNSNVYWFLMAVPVLFLVWDVRVSQRSCREALFTALTDSVIAILQWIVAPFLCWFCLFNARQLCPSHFLLGRLTTPASMAVTAVDFLANALGQSVYSSQASATTTKSNWLSCVGFYSSTIIRCGAVLAITFATYDWERRHDCRFMSCSNVYMCQVLAALILGQLLPRILDFTTTNTSTAVSRNAALSGCVKFVASMTMYTAGATKIGESHGLGWIDDRYLAQLSLRGRYSQGSPYPLESWLLWSPPSLRAMGMLTVLVMELVSVFSWWDFGRHYRYWILFQIGSTLSIGVPIVPHVLAGPLWLMLERGLEQCSTVQGCVWLIAATTSTVLALVAIVCVALGKTSIMPAPWTSRQGHMKRD